VEPLSASAPIIPDGYWELESPSKLYAMFLEVDLATEPLKVWEGKFTAYLRFATTGEFHKRFGRDRFRVLIITRSERRTGSLRKLAIKFTEKIFWFATVTSAAVPDFWKLAWLRPSGTHTLPLL